MANLTAKNPIPVKEDEASLVYVMLPVQPNDGTGKQEPNEHVTLNGKVTEIPFGVYTAVAPEVFMALRAKYPTI